MRHAAGAHERQRHAVRRDRAHDAQPLPRSLADLQVWHIRTQIDTPWTNCKVEVFWVTLHAEVLDRQDIADLAAAERAVTAYAGYYNYHRLHGELGWRTPAERFDGTPFTDRGFEKHPGTGRRLGAAIRAAPGGLTVSNRPWKITKLSS